MSRDYSLLGRQHRFFILGAGVLCLYGTLKLKTENTGKLREQEIRRKFGGVDCGTPLLIALHELGREKEACCRDRKAKKV